MSTNKGRKERRIIKSIMQFSDELQLATGSGEVGIALSGKQFDSLAAAVAELRENDKSYVGSAVGSWAQWDPPNEIRIACATGYVTVRRETE